MKPGLNMSQFVGPWGINPQHLETAISLLRAMGMEEAVQVSSEIDDLGKPEVGKQGRVAVIRVNGPMTKHSHAMMGAFGGTSTVDTIAAIQRAVADPSIDAIVLRIDSPGGTVAGSVDLADFVAQATKVKPIVAFAEDMAASAAYWLASQTEHIVANRTAQLGSIGVITMVYDVSKLFTDIGVRTIPVTTAKFKGAFAMGTQVTDEQVERLRAEITPVHEQFVQAVQSGRKLDAKAVEAAADGRLFAAPVALKLGLIDAIGGIGDAAAKALELAQARAPAGGSAAAAGASEGTQTGAHSEASNTPRGEHPTGQADPAPVNPVATPAGKIEGKGQGEGAPAAQLSAADAEALFDRKLAAMRADIRKEVAAEYEQKLAGIEQRFVQTDEREVAQARTRLALEFGVPETSLAHLKSKADVDAQRAILSAATGGQGLPTHEAVREREAAEKIPDAFAAAEAYHREMMTARGTPIIMGGA